MMDLVPRPSGGGSAVKWGQKQVREFIIKRMKDNGGKHYVVCMKASAAAMKNDFYMAEF